MPKSFALQNKTSTAVSNETSPALNRRDALLQVLGIGAIATVASACVDDLGTTDATPDDLAEVEQLLTGNDSPLLVLDTIAFLRARYPGYTTPAPDNVVTPETCIVLGHSAIGDRGGGLFFWDATSSLADDDGMTIRPATNPAYGRWRRQVTGHYHAAWWGITDISTGNAQRLSNAASASAGSMLEFLPGMVITLQAAITFAGDIRLRTNGSSFLIDHISSPALTFAANFSADDFTLNTAFGRVVPTAVRFEGRVDADRVAIISFTHQQNLSAGNQHGGMEIARGYIGTTGPHRIGQLEISHYDRSLVAVDADDLAVQHVDISYFAVAIKLINCRRVTILSGRIYANTGAVTGAPGENGLLIESCRNVAISALTVEDSGEHGIRIGGASPSFDISFSQIAVLRPGRGGLKVLIDHATDKCERLSIAGLTVVDAGYSLTNPDSNSNALSLQRCKHVTVTGLQAVTSNKSWSCWAGLYLRGVEFATISAPSIQDSYSHGMYASDYYGNVNYINVVAPRFFWTNATTGDPDRCGVYFDYPVGALRDVTVTSAYVRGHRAKGVKLTIASAPQPNIFQGWIETSSGAAFECNIISSNVVNSLVAV